jgi:hypothetical protein
MQIAGYSLVGGELNSGIQISKNPVQVGMSAFSGHPSLHRICPLSGVKRTWPIAVRMSGYDPKRTLDLSPIGLIGSSH